MSPEIFFDTFEGTDPDDPEDRGDHLRTCKRIVHQILFDQARGVSAEQSVEWECDVMCTVPGESAEREPRRGRD